MKEERIAECPQCMAYQGKHVSQIPRLIDEGVINVDAGSFMITSIQMVDWILAKSERQSVGPKEGTHYIFTTFSHHIGNEQTEARARLVAKAMEIGQKLARANNSTMRLVVNTGSRYPTPHDHFRAHIIITSLEACLPRVTANIRATLETAQERFDGSNGVIQYVCRSIMQPDILIKK